MFRCMQCPRECGKNLITNVMAVNACESFGNDNGKLVCEGEGTSTGNDEERRELLANAYNVPQGSYRGSCGGCHVVEKEDVSATFLSCSACRNWKGVDYASTMVIGECRSIGNDNGQLVCEDDTIPPGAYQDSCSDCRLMKGRGGTKVLTCRCRNSLGKKQDTLLVPPEDSTTGNFDTCQDIENENGHLVCVQGRDDDNKEGKSEAHDEL